MSTGFLRPAAGGRNARRLASVSGASSGSERPCASQASASRMPGPPAFVTTPTRGPGGTGCVDSSATTSNRSSSVFVRITPACSKSASTATSRQASAAEWLDAARRAGGGAPGLDRDDRLLPRDLGRQAREPARVAEALEVERDHVRLRDRPSSRRAGRCRTRPPCCRPRRRSRCRCSGRARSRGWRGRARRSARACRRCPAGRAWARRSRSATRRGRCSARPCSSGPTMRMPHARTSVAQAVLLGPALGGHLGEAGGDHDDAARARRARSPRPPPRPWRRARRSRPGRTAGRWRRRSGRRAGPRSPSPPG